jgi:hypothetical protein
MHGAGAAGFAGCGTLCRAHRVAASDKILYFQ